MEDPFVLPEWIDSVCSTARLHLPRTAQRLWFNMRIDCVSHMSSLLLQFLPLLLPVPDSYSQKEIYGTMIYNSSEGFLSIWMISKIYWIFIILLKILHFIWILFLFFHYLPESKPNAAPSLVALIPFSYECTRMFRTHTTPHQPTPEQTLKYIKNFKIEIIFFFPTPA